MTVVARFQQSLHELFGVLSTSRLQFIRCLSPNGNFDHADFDNDKIDRQLEACGIVESIQVSAAGHANKIVYASFLKRYQLCLLPASFKRSNTGLSDIATAKDIVAAHVRRHIGSVRYGISRIFLKQGHFQGVCTR